MPSTVVIPWRGFRCFTPLLGIETTATGVIARVVIPWRGFRCFTHNTTVFRLVDVDGEL